MDGSVPAPKEPKSRRPRLLLRWSAAVLSMAGLAVGGFTASGAISSKGAAKLTHAKYETADRAIAEAITRDFSRFALNALLATLLDDDEPPRWSDVGLGQFCGPAAHVEVNGMPLVHGSRLPATAFNIRWTIDQCAPLEAIELNGTVELLVFHDDDSLSAVVLPQRLIVSSAKGTGHMSAPFSSSLSLLSAQHRP